jgi:hypothetical protein
VANIPTASCRTEVQQFNEATSCLHNSNFLINCGSCQQCIATYIVQQDLENDEYVPPPGLSVAMSRIIDLCKGTPASTDVQALQSQASRISGLGVVLASTTGGARATGSVATTTVAVSTPTSTPTSIPENSAPLSRARIAGPVVGSILGVVAIILMIIFIRRRQGQRDMEEPMKNIHDDDTNSSTEGKAQLHSDSVVVRELEDTEVRQPVELPAVEPVGSELNTPRDCKMDPIEKWPVPLSPLSVLFVLTEMRDERTGNNESPKHETFYHP